MTLSPSKALWNSSISISIEWCRELNFFLCIACALNALYKCGIIRKTGTGLLFTYIFANSLDLKWCGLFRRHYSPEAYGKTTRFMLLVLLSPQPHIWSGNEKFQYIFGERNLFSDTTQIKMKVSKVRRLFKVLFSPEKRQDYYHNFGLV